jgi:capsular polysaccharide biosynthesis protein
MIVTQIIGAPNTTENFMVKDYKVYSVKNVISIDIKKENQLGWDVTHNQEIDNNILSYFFYFDCEQSDAFAHWVFESAFYLPLFKELKKVYPSLKVLTYKKKNYMISFFKAFDIVESDIVYNISSISNEVFFPETSTLAIHSHVDMYMKYVRDFYLYLTKDISPNKRIPVLYLPRGTAENFVPNDRRILCQEQLVELLPIAVPNSQVYFTDTTQNIKDQIALIRSAEVLVVDYGSNLMFNGYFAENAKVVVIGNIHRHVENPRPYELIKDSEKRNVRYYYLPGSVQAHEVLQVVNFLLTNEAPPYHHELKCWRHCEYCLSDV